MNAILIISTAGLLIIVFIFFMRNIYLERRTKELIQLKSKVSNKDELLRFEICVDCAEFAHLLLKYAGHFPEVMEAIKNATPIPLDWLKEPAK